MKLRAAKSGIFVTLAIVGLAAGTALVAGYVDQPTQAEKVSATSMCNDCPLKGTDECCKVTGVCAECPACAGCEAKGACGVACEEKAQTASCGAPACASQVPSTCGAGACCPDAQ